MHWQHSLNSEMIFSNIETLRLDHWFHTQLNIYKNILLKCQIKKYFKIWNYPAVFWSHIFLSVVFNLTTLNWLYIMLILIQVMKMQFNKILKECYFSNSSVSICFAWENGTISVLDKFNKMIYIDPLFCKQTSPKFHVRKSCPVLYYLYIFYKTRSDNIQKQQNMVELIFQYFHKIFSYFLTLFFTLVKTKR
jgi:hypothetical protein